MRTKEWRHGWWSPTRSWVDLILLKIALTNWRRRLNNRMMKYLSFKINVLIWNQRLTTKINKNKMPITILTSFKIKLKITYRRSRKMKKSLKKVQRRIDPSQIVFRIWSKWFYLLTRKLRVSAPESPLVMPQFKKVRMTRVN